MKYSDLLKNLKTCPFCPDNRSIFIDRETAFLTYSLAPYHPDHLMVVPKRHIEHLLDVSDSEMRDIDILQKDGLKILQNLGYENISFLVREGDESGKSIKHLHYHIIPDITLGDQDHTGADREVLSDGEVEMLISRLQTVIDSF